MRHKPAGSRPTATVIISLLLVCFILSVPHVAAQDNKYGFAEVPVVTVRRVVKKKRVIGRPRRRPRKAVERVPLLAVLMRLYKVGENGAQVETNPQSQFYAGDRLRLGVIANQDGYLTIIRQAGADQDGEILFPTSLIDQGRNDVEAGKEYVVPSNCPANVRPSDCAYALPQSAGVELFTIIFSRDLISSLPANATTASGSIRADTIREIEADSERQLAISPGRSGRSRYSLLIVNKNRADNEEIFLRYPISNRGPSPLRR